MRSYISPKPTVNCTVARNLNNDFYKNIKYPRRMPSKSRIMAVCDRLEAVNHRMKNYLELVEDYMAEGYDESTACRMADYEFNISDT